MENTEQLTSRLQACYTGIVHDVMRELGLIGYTLPPALRPILPGVTLAGRVWTYGGQLVDIDPHESLLEWTGVLSEAPRGHVLVCQPNDRTVAHIGELSAVALQVRGIRGMVIDGGARDVRFLVEIGFPVFCRYFTPRDIVGCWAPAGLGEPVTIGEVTIRQGDFVLGDDDGVQIIPQVHIEMVLDRAHEAMSRENSVREAVLDQTDPREAYLRYGKF